MLPNLNVDTFFRPLLCFIYNYIESLGTKKSCSPLFIAIYQALRTVERLHNKQVTKHTKAVTEHVQVVHMSRDIHLSDR